MISLANSSSDLELSRHERHRLDQDIGAIMAWVNTYLKQRSCPAHSIETDFRDGVRLIVLLEIAFNARIPSYNSRPKLSFHRLDNLAIAFQFCSEHGVLLLNIDPHSIMNGVVKSTLNLFQSLLRALTIKGLKDFNHSAYDHNDNLAIPAPSFRSQLLRWVSDTFAGIVPNLQIDNFWSSFVDGVVFCGLIESLVPGSIDLAAIRCQSSAEKLALAFRVSEERLGIPAILKPQDFCTDRKPDEAAVELYISMLVSSAAGTRRRDSSALEQVNAIKLKKEKEMEQIKERMQENEMRMQLMIEASQVAASKERMALAEYKTKYNQLLEHSQKSHELLQQLSASESDLRARVDELDAAVEKRDCQIAELQTENARLKSEVYAIHIEAMDIQNRFQSEENRIEIDSTPSSQTEVAGARLSKDDLRAAAAELLSQAPIRKGWLMVRKIGGGFFVKQKPKKRYFELRGDCLYHSDKKSANISSCKMIKLSQYQKLEIESEPVDLYEDFKLLISGASCSRNTTDDGADGQMVLRLISKSHKAGINSYELAAVQSFDDEFQEDVHVWKQEINDQIALQDYLRDVENGLASTCKEFIDFVADPSRNILSICDQPHDLHRVLAVFKESLIMRQNLSLIIDNVALSPSSLEVIGEIVAKNNSIRVLKLPNNQISSVAIRPLVEALKVNRSLQELSLSNNHIKDDGVRMLSDSLAYHPRLRALRLSGNNISCAGVTGLCNGIRGSSQRFRWEHVFPTLDLSSNCIGDRGCESIADLLRSNATIIRLRLNRNQITDVGLGAIAAALRANPRPIEEIQLAQNQLTSRGVVELADALQDLQTVHQIDLSRNQMIGRSGISRLLLVDIPIKFKAFAIVRGQVDRGSFAGSFHDDRSRD